MDGFGTVRLTFKLRCLLLLACLAGFSSTGCAVFMASRAPGRKDMSVLTPGVSRSQVVAELGQPLQSRQSPLGNPKDVFAFKQGYSAGNRVGRVVLHGTADVVTGFLWELAGTPMEASMQGEDVRVEVEYDPEERIRRIEYFAGAHLAHGEPSLPAWWRRETPRQTAVIESHERAEPAPGPPVPQIPGVDQGVRQTSATEHDLQ